MVPKSTRRRVLQGSVLGITASLSGCMGVSLGGGNEPDEGSDSYGILVLNEMDQTFTVSVEVRRLLEDDQVFAESVTVEPDERHEWEQVLTEAEVQYRVVASLENSGFYDQKQQNRATVSVATATSPDIENILVKVAPYFDTQTVWVNTTQYGQE